MQNIKIEIRAKQARAVGSPVIVCGNTDYSMTFDFDEEWAEARVKTARFAYAQGAEVKYRDIVFEGDTIEVPQLSNVREVRVGVFSGDLRTTTAAWVACEPSILCGSGAPDEPIEDVYNQIMELLNEALNGGGSGGGPGKPGAPGLSAYEIAKAHGFKGTEEEWLASLKGEPGRDGIDGKDGQPGRDGIDGYTPVKGVDYFDGKDGAAGADGKTPVKGVDYFDGAKGEKGDPFTYEDFTEEQLASLKGADGKDGYTPQKGIDYFDGEKGADGKTPVKGEDYFTKADKDELVTEVLNALPVWNGGEY